MNPTPDNPNNDYRQAPQAANILQPLSPAVGSANFDQTPVKKKQAKKWLSTVALFLLAPLLAYFINSFVFQTYQVDGPSMQNTLYTGDRLIVSKVGKTWANLSGSDYIPSRGTVIIFKKPTTDVNPNGVSVEKQLVKRVIGIPGDRVVVADGRLKVYNSDHPTGYDPDIGSVWQDDAITPVAGNVDITVPKGSIFAVGDNRQNSLDSRYFGTVKADLIIGSLKSRILPLSKARNF
jgi:signal peptidase I